MSVLTDFSGIILGWDRDEELLEIKLLDTGQLRGYIALSSWK